MKKTSKFYFLITIMMLLSIQKFCFGQSSALRYFFWKPSSVSMALGGTGVSFYNGSFSSYFNPALFSDVNKIRLSTAYVEPLPFFDDIKHTYYAISGQIHDGGFLTASANLIFQPQQVLVSDDGMIYGADGTGNDNYHYLYKLSYAYNYNSWLSLGAGVGLFDVYLNKARVGSENAKRKTGGIIFDFGLFASGLLEKSTIHLKNMDLPSFINDISEYDGNAGLNAGISLINIGQDIFFVDKAQTDPLPSVLLAGVSYWPITSNFLSVMLTAELENRINEDSFIEMIRSGIEMNIFQIFALRTGYVNSLNNAGKSFPCFGFGLNSKILSVNYSRYNSTFISTWHLDATLGVEF